MLIRYLMVAEKLPNIYIDGKCYTFIVESIIRDMWTTLRKTQEITDSDVSKLFSRYEEHLSYLMKCTDKGIGHKHEVRLPGFDFGEAEKKEACNIWIRPTVRSEFIFQKTCELLSEVITLKNIKRALFLAGRCSRSWKKTKKGLMGKTIVVIINGFNGVGKDTFVECFKSVSHEPVLNVSTVDKIKEAAAILGWDGNKDSNARAALHDLKNLGNKYFNHSRRYIEDFVKTNNGCFIFVHCREPLEIQYFKDNLKNIKDDIQCYTLLVTNDRVTPADNQADLGVFNYNYDITVENNYSIESLRSVSDKVLKDLMEE